MGLGEILKKINVLSLFDGISCGQLALERANIEVERYYASEINKYTIQITERNYPKTIQLGDVTTLYVSSLPKIDLLVGGSPCQNLSFAGKQQGMSTKSKIEILTLEHYLELKDNGFEFTGESYLFWEFIRILRTTNPKYFILENVKMSEKWKNVFTETIGTEPILINSSLVSAQNRQRYYWTNIPGVEQPEDKEIYLKDIVLKDVHPVALHNLYGGFKEKAVRVFEGKSPTIRTAAGGGHIPSLVLKDFEKLFVGDHLAKEYKGGNQLNESYKSQANTVHLNSKSPPICAGTHGYANGYIIDTDKIKKLSDSKDVANFFKSKPYSLFKDWNAIRKFHPVECERLQTMPDNYTEGVSNTQRYKAIGNGWTIDVIAHILKYAKFE